MTAVAPRRAVWVENRERIVSAARELFSQRGYRGTTTRNLAATAGVVEPTLYRHFPSKAALFDVAVVQPVQEFLEQFVARRASRPVGLRDVEEATREFYAELYDEIVRDARPFVALVAALTFDEPEVSEQVRPRLRGMLRGLDRHFALEFGERGFAAEPHVTLRIMVAAVLGLAIQGDWLFGDRRRPSREALIDGLTQLTVHGLAAGA